MVLVSAASTSGWLYCAVLPMLIEKSEAPNCTMSMPGTDRPHRLVGVLRLLDLYHAGHVHELERAAEIVEVVHGERRVLGGELDVIVLLGMADQLHQRRPGRQDVRAHGRLAGVQTFAE